MAQGRGNFDLMHSTTCMSHMPHGRRGSLGNLSSLFKEREHNSGGDAERIARYKIATQVGAGRLIWICMDPNKNAQPRKQAFYSHGPGQARLLAQPVETKKVEDER